MYKQPITDLGHEVFCIDTQMGGHDGITAAYLVRSSKPVLIETGAAKSAPVVIAALTELGIGSADLATIVVTHIHLDHAGGVGDIARAYPLAQVVVHEKGARHLADPTRLVASAHRVFGPDMDRLFGDLIPTDSIRITALGEIGSIDLGDGRRLDTFHNPGHASHHIGLLDSVSGDLYTGDAAGVYIPETADVRPATPPPDFDLHLALSSLKRMAEARADRLLFSHFGPVTDIETTLALSEAELHYWVEDVTTAYTSGLDIDHAVAMVKEKDELRHPQYYANIEALEKFEDMSSLRAQVDGVWRWLEKTQARPDA